jgi:hypothetical protein
MAPTGSATQYYSWAVDATSPPYSDGNWAYSDSGGSTWIAAASKDALFRILFDSTVTGNNMLTAFYKDYNSITGMVYLTRTASPYQMKVARINEQFDSVLTISNTIPDNWKIRLKAYDQAGIERLSNCTIYFRSGSYSSQIYVDRGTYGQPVGSWYDLQVSGTVHVGIITSASGALPSKICVYLEVLVPQTTVYYQYILTFLVR